MLNFIHCTSQNSIQMVQLKTFMEGLLTEVWAGTREPSNKMKTIGDNEQWLERTRGRSNVLKPGKGNHR